MGWGTAQQVRNPYYAINAFYDALEKIPDYQSMRITEAAQKVQRSGFPEAYEDHAIDARALASVLTGYSPGGLFTCVVHEPTERGSGDRVIRQVQNGPSVTSTSRAPARARTSPLTAARQRGGPSPRLVGATVRVAHGVRLHPERVAYADKQWRVGRDSEDGWARRRPADETEVAHLDGLSPLRSV